MEGGAKGTLGAEIGEVGGGTVSRRRRSPKKSHRLQEMAWLSFLASVLLGRRRCDIVATPLQQPQECRITLTHAHAHSHIHLKKKSAQNSLCKRSVHGSQDRRRESWLGPELRGQRSLLTGRVFLFLKGNVSGVCGGREGGERRGRGAT